MPLLFLMPILVAYTLLVRLWTQLMGRAQEARVALTTLSLGLMSHAGAWLLLLAISSNLAPRSPGVWMMSPLAYGLGQLFLLVSWLALWLNSSDEEGQGTPRGWAGVAGLCCLLLFVPPGMVLWFLNNFRIGGF